MTLGSLGSESRRTWAWLTTTIPLTSSLCSSNSWWKRDLSQSGSLRLKKILRTKGVDLRLSTPICPKSDSTTLLHLPPAKWSQSDPLTSLLRPPPPPLLCLLYSVLLITAIKECTGRKMKFSKGLSNAEPSSSDLISLLLILRILICASRISHKVEMKTT